MATFKVLETMQCLWNGIAIVITKDILADKMQQTETKYNRKQRNERQMKLSPGPLQYRRFGLELSYNGEISVSQTNYLQ